MFDIAFSELVVIGVVAVVVIGPERLPSVARGLGRMMGRVSRYMGQVKAEWHNEMIMEEWRNAKSEAEKTIHDFKSQVELADLSVRRDADHLANTIAAPETVRAPQSEGASSDSPSPADAAAHTKPS